MFYIGSSLKNNWNPRHEIKYNKTGPLLKNKHDIQRKQY